MHHSDISIVPVKHKKIQTLHKMTFLVTLYLYILLLAWKKHLATLYNLQQICLQPLKKNHIPPRVSRGHYTKIGFYTYWSRHLDMISLWAYIITLYTIYSVVCGSEYMFKGAKSSWEGKCFTETNFDKSWWECH